MQKYIQLTRICFQDQLQYRSEIVTRSLRYAINVVLIAVVWLAIAKANPHSAIDPQFIVRYYFLTAIIYGLSNFHTDNVEYDIRMGQISKYFVKPQPAFSVYFLFQGSMATLETVLKIVLMVPVLFAIGFPLTLDLGRVLLTLTSLPIIFFAMFSLYFGLSGLAFWFQAVDSIRMSVMFCFRFLSGVFVPIILFPEWLIRISSWLPFANMAYRPVQLLLGQLSPSETLTYFISLLCWAGLFFVFQKIIWHKATHSYDSNGI